VRRDDLRGLEADLDWFHSVADPMDP
jgi:hypothetical protein